MLKKVKEEAFKYFRNITEQVSKKNKCMWVFKLGKCVDELLCCRGADT